MKTKLEELSYNLYHRVIGCRSLKVCEETPYRLYKELVVNSSTTENIDEAIKELKSSLKINNESIQKVCRYIRILNERTENIIREIEKEQGK